MLIERTGRLRALAQATIDENLQRGTCHRGKQGTLTWTLATDRSVIGYLRRSDAMPRSSTARAGHRVPRSSGSDWPLAPWGDCGAGPEPLTRLCQGTAARVRSGPWPAVPLGKSSTPNTLTSRPSRAPQPHHLPQRRAVIRTKEQLSPLGQRQRNAAPAWSTKDSSSRIYFSTVSALRCRVTSMILSILA